MYQVSGGVLVSQFSLSLNSVQTWTLKARASICEAIARLLETQKADNRIYCRMIEQFNQCDLSAQSLGK